MSVMHDPSKTDQERFSSFFSEVFPDLNASLRSLVPNGGESEEILQNVAMVLWEKYHDVLDREEFRKLAFTVLRFEVLSYRRDRMRNRLVFDDAVISLIVDHSTEKKQAFNLRQELLHKYAARLSEEDRELLFDVYRSGATVADLAKQQGKSAVSLYKKMRKIRKTILENIQTEINAKNQ